MREIKNVSDKNFSIKSKVSKIADDMLSRKESIVSPSRG